MKQKMGQYRKTKKGKPKEEKVEFIVQAVKRKGKPYILLTKNIINAANLIKGIYKIKIQNDQNLEYYFEYKGQPSIKIQSKLLKPGKYRISFSPVTLKKFVYDFNRKIEKRHKIALSLENEKLYLVTPDGKYQLYNWKFEKALGGRLRIRAEAIGLTREIIVLLFRLNPEGFADIRIVTDVRKEKGETTREVKIIESFKDLGFGILYKHSTKEYYVTYVAPKHVVDALNKLEQLNISFNLVTKRDNLEIYTYKTDERTGYIFRCIYGLSMTLGKAHASPSREPVGIKIAKKFLMEIGAVNIEEHPLCRRGVDLTAIINGARTAFEVKITTPKMQRLHLKDAINEIREHVFERYRDFIRSVRIKKYGVIVITINFQRERFDAYGNLYIMIWDLKGEEKHDK